MPSAQEALRGDREPLPEWLLKANEFRPEDFFSSNVVYYPGSGTDGQATSSRSKTWPNHCRSPSTPVPNAYYYRWQA